MLTVVCWFHIDTSTSKLIHICSTVYFLTSFICALWHIVRDCCDLRLRRSEIRLMNLRRRKRLRLDTSEWVWLTCSINEGIILLASCSNFRLFKQQLLSLGLNLRLKHSLLVIEFFATCLCIFQLSV